MLRNALLSVILLLVFFTPTVKSATLGQDIYSAYGWLLLHDPLPEGAPTTRLAEEVSAATVRFFREALQAQMPVARQAALTRTMGQIVGRLSQQHDDLLRKQILTQLFLLQTDQPEHVLAWLIGAWALYFQRDTQFNARLAARLEDPHPSVRHMAKHLLNILPSGPKGPLDLEQSLCALLLKMD